MKKKFGGLLILSFALAFVACSGQQIQETTSSISQVESTDSDLYDVPKGIYKEYEQADFKEMNSTAEENGLGNTAVWFEGKIGKISASKIDNEIYYLSTFTDNDGNEWMLMIDAESVMLDNTLEEYEEYVGDDVLVCGIYQGYSSYYDMPAVYSTKLFDRVTGNSITTGWAKCTTSSPEYDENYNKRVLGYSSNSSKTDTQETSEVSEINMKDYPIATTDDIAAQNYDNELVRIENCVIEEASDSFPTIWYPSSSGYIKFSSVTLKKDIADIKDGDVITVLTHAYKDGSYGGIIEEVEITGNIDLNSVYESYEGNCQPLDYEAVLRNPKGMKGTRVYVSGTIKYIASESNTRSEYVLSTDDGYVYINYAKEAQPRFIEGDYITVYGYTTEALKETALQIDTVPDIWSILITM